MICAAPAAPPVSVHQCQLCAHPCHLPVPISATSVPHIIAHLSCLSVSPISAMPVSATYQCRLSVPYISAAFQCPSVMPVNAQQCHLPVPPHQCSLSVPTTEGLRQPLPPPLLPGEC
ncbi:unnamed protein product, partial [Staurois parvus]